MTAKKTTAKKTTKAAAAKKAAVSAKADAPEAVIDVSSETCKEIIGAIKEASNVAVAADKVSKRKAGIYTSLMGLAAKTGHAEFLSSCDAVFNAIAANTDGLAKALKCKTNKKGKFLVPSNVSSAKSVIKAAFETNTPLLEDNGEVRPFTAVRTDVQTARKLEATAKLSDEERERIEARDEAVAALKEMAESLAKIEVDGAQADHLRALTTSLADWTGFMVGLSGSSDESEEDTREAA